MDDPISRQAAIDAFKKELTVGESKGNYVTICAAIGYEGVKQILESLPSVDAVEVVRCEQCKHYNNIDFHCYYHGSMCFKPNDYCTYGEVRNDK